MLGLERSVFFLSVHIAQLFLHIFDAPFKPFFAIEPVRQVIVGVRIPYE